MHFILTQAANGYGIERSTLRSVIFGRRTSSIREMCDTRIAKERLTKEELKSLFSDRLNSCEPLKSSA